VRIRLVTDSFPPRAGGSGWSTFELARGLVAHGHVVDVVHVVPGRRAGVREREYEGLRVAEYRVPAPPVPFARNVARNERLYPRLGAWLAEGLARDRIDIVHGQHAMSGPASVLAARAPGGHRSASVVTIRDYWPVCYWSDLILDPSSPALCPGCSAARMTRCVRPHAGPAWPLALPIIPYMRANLARKQSMLSRAHAVVAVASTIACDLRERAAGLDTARLHVVHNAVDVNSLRRAAAATVRPLDRPYAVFVGKLETNKGVQHLLPAVREAKLPGPLVVVGDGSWRGRLEDEARRLSLPVQVTGWRERHEVLAWLAHATLLVFPSYGPESLSRVLVESSALGVPMAAMDTGGTRDIVIHEETGLLAATPEAFARDVARLCQDDGLRRRLGAGARRRAEAVFDTSAVVPRMEQVYREALARAEAPEHG
jgi:glycosyltransferase involved in cell wall biosynthesis